MCNKKPTTVIHTNELVLRVADSAAGTRDEAIPLPRARGADARIVVAHRALSRSGPVGPPTGPQRRRDGLGDVRIGIANAAVVVVVEFHGGLRVGAELLVRERVRYIDTMLVAQARDRLADGVALLNFNLLGRKPFPLNVSTLLCGGKTTPVPLRGVSWSTPSYASFGRTSLYGPF